MVKAPTPDHPGVVEEGWYTIDETLARVWDAERSKLLGSQTFKPGDDVEAIARKLLRRERPKLDMRYPVNAELNVLIPASSRTLRR